MIDATPAFARLIFLAAVTAAVVLPAPRAHAQPPPSWRWPLPGSPEVVRGFDPPDLPWGAGHRGVDLGAYPGEPVYAAGPGRAGYVGRIAGHGIVTIVHDARRTTYLPVRPAVHAGERVAAGTRIGSVEPGFGHCPMRVCLHWGLLRGTTYLDPLTLLPRSPIRLLPLTDPFLLAASLTGHTPPPRIRPVSDLAESALAGSGGAGVVLLVLAALGRTPRRRPEDPPLSTAKHYHPAGGRHPDSPPLAEVHPLPTGRHRRAHRLKRLFSQLHRTPDPDPAPLAEVIDLDTERRLRRPTQTNERDPA